MWWMRSNIGRELYNEVSNKLKNKACRVRSTAMKADDNSEQLKDYIKEIKLKAGAL